MALARKHQIDLTATQYYHCISRCVRQAFLCGKSKQTGTNYEHRRAWVVSRLKVLAEIFSINICAYAIMSNHYHLVLHVDVEAAKTWSTSEVISRWKRLFKYAPEVDMLQSDVENKLVEKWRRQLTDISWFMRCLNEYLARRANIEEGCKGRFWEGRYKSQALLDESALLTCMSYVDLNPVRAGLCESLEESDFTAIQQRLCTYEKNKHLAKPQLMHFRNKTETTGIPFDAKSYFELVRWTGTIIVANKRGFIPATIKHTLNLHDINETQWLQAIQHFGGSYSWLIGRVDEIKERCIILRRKWVQGVSASNKYFLNHAA
jgi:REP element-mobilizing transposase RayT